MSRIQPSPTLTVERHQAIEETTATNTTEPAVSGGDPARARSYVIGQSRALNRFIEAPLEGLRPPGVVRMLPRGTAELSGAAHDARRHITWSLGDSGENGTKLVRRDERTGEEFVIATRGFANVDWEALVLDEEGTPWILDVGDNLAKRKEVQLAELDLASLSLPRGDESEAIGSVGVKRVLHVMYGDGPMDVEAGFIKDKNLYLIEKTFDPARIVAVDLSGTELSRGDTGSIHEASVVARELGTLDFDLHTVTDATLSPEGVLYILTSDSVIKVDPFDDPSSLRDAVAVELPFAIRRSQAEAIYVKGGEIFIGSDLGNFVFSLSACYREEGLGAPDFKHQPIAFAPKRYDIPFHLTLLDDRGDPLRDDHGTPLVFDLRQGEPFTREVMFRGAQVRLHAEMSADDRKSVSVSIDGLASSEAGQPVSATSDLLSRPYLRLSLSNGIYGAIKR